MTRTVEAKILHLEKVLAVQTTFLTNYKEGMTKTFIHRQYVKDTYYITYRTMLRYLDMNAKRELRILKKQLCES